MSSGGSRSATASCATSSSSGAPGVRPISASSAVGGAQRGAAHAEQAQGDALHGTVATELDRGSDAREGEVAAATRDLDEPEPATTFPYGNVDGDEELLVAHTGGPGALEELRRGDATRATGGSHLELGTQSERDGRELGRGIGVRDRPTDRPAVADLRVADERHRSSEERRGRRRLSRRARPRAGASSRRWSTCRSRA